MEPKIHIFLSYRRSHPDDLNAREELKKQCESNGFQLIYDEENLKEGERISEFMNDIGAARCVVMFLSPEYFQSAYTLYELIQIHEHECLDQRFIFPLRATADMHDYVITNAKNDCWLKDEAVRVELCRRLGEDDQEKVWQRVLDAWNYVVADHLDKKQSSLEDVAFEKVLSEVLEIFKSEIESLIKEQQEVLRREIASEIEYYLSKGHISLVDLCHKLGVDQSHSFKEVAHALTKKQVGEAIADVTSVISDQKSILKDKEDWSESLKNVEQLCGWLLIGSVHPLWWFHHELKMKRLMKRDIKNQLTLEEHAYAEVIISRSLVRSAEYRLNDGRLIGAADHCNTMLLFDSSPKATNMQILSDILRDLAPEYQDDFNSEEEILDKIHRRAVVLQRTKKKPVYYLVSKDILNLLAGGKLFEIARQKLAGCLQFIYCELKPRSETIKTIPSSNEDQGLLLEQIEYLLSLREK